MSADITEDIDDLLTWISEVMSNADIPVDTTEVDDILTWISNEGTPSSAIPDDKMEINSLLTWIAEALSCPEVPRQPLPDVPSSLGTSPFSRGAPDFPTGSRELSREVQADAGPLSEPFSAQPVSSGQLSEPLLRRHLMEEARQRQPRVVLPRLALPTRMDARVPPSAHSARLIEEAKQRQPRVVLTRLALPSGCISCHMPGNHHEDGTEPAECPAPACTTRKGRNRGHEQRAGSVPARKRKLLLGQDAPGQKRRR
ncbi:uncharacterized protein LOC116240076 isoform X2 [Phasianus colchicus]|uniref:uncharacterized protein LOC116240076 isoform X2 n=1 Tax=Phasianus colchicus TaxID=9054 RepID=UPI00129ECFD1|nr:uncharacterized protein LOC116240076 isoform X2 [Phasianus colchicus]